MKQSEIEVGKEYTIGAGVLKDELYFARYSKLSREYFVITAKVIATNVKREYSERNDGVTIQLTGDALAELTSYYFNDDRKNEFTISNRQVLESTEAIAQAYADAEAERERLNRVYQEEQAAKGAELDTVVLAHMERKAHENSGDELRRVRQELENTITRAQDCLSYIADAEAPRGHRENGWTTPLPTIGSWQIPSFAAVPAAIAKYNAAAELHNDFVAAREAGQFERIDA